MGADSVMVGEGECWLMVGRVGVWQLDSLDILRSGLWVVVRTAEGGGPAASRLSSRVNCKAAGLVHVSTERTEAGL